MLVPSFHTLGSQSSTIINHFPSKTSPIHLLKNSLYGGITAKIILSGSFFSGAICGASLFIVEKIVNKVFNQVFFKRDIFPSCVRLKRTLPFIKKSSIIAITYLALNLLKIPISLPFLVGISLGPHLLLLSGIVLLFSTSILYSLAFIIVNKITHQNRRRPPDNTSLPLIEGKTFKIIDKEHLGKEEENCCSICYQELFAKDSIDSNEVLRTRCRHVYHKICLYDWFKEKPNSPNCPVCRTSFNSQSGT